MERYSCLGLHDLESLPLSAYFAEATQRLKSCLILSRLPNNISEVRLYSDVVSGLHKKQYCLETGNAKMKSLGHINPPAKFPLASHYIFYWYVMPVPTLNPTSIYIPMCQSSEEVIFSATFTLIETLTTVKSKFYFTNITMNSEWSSLVRVYSFQRIFQLVRCKGATGGLRHQFLSTLGKAVWRCVALGGGIALLASWE